MRNPATSPPSRAYRLFFFNDTATTEIYTLSLHDALPILPIAFAPLWLKRVADWNPFYWATSDRKSTRLNSSHLGISYAVFCLKKKLRRRRLGVRVPACSVGTCGSTDGLWA